ncbi:hypothetical protein FOXYSP1_19214 [Fusarium oxysporum f. sp. phaseoli]
MRNETDFPKALQAADSWPDYIQRVSAEYWLPASHLALDECMVPLVGRSEEKTSGKDQPMPVWSKIRVVFPTRLHFSVAMTSTVATLEIGDALWQLRKPEISPHIKSNSQSNTCRRPVARGS